MIVKKIYLLSVRVNDLGEVAKADKQPSSDFPLRACNNALLSDDDKLF